MPLLSTHFLTNAMLTGMNLTRLVQTIGNGGPVTDIPPLFEQLYFANIAVKTDTDSRQRFYTMEDQLQKGLLETLGRLKHTEPLIALVTALNLKDRLNTHVDKEQGRADPAHLIAPLLDDLAELSAFEDLPPTLRAKSFISLLNDPQFNERESAHLSSVRSALRLLDNAPLPQLIKAELAAACINGARGYLGKYEPETEIDLNIEYGDLAEEAVRQWCSTVEAMPTNIALTHMCNVHFNARWDEFEKLAAAVTSGHYESPYTHTSVESFRDILSRMPSVPKAF